jgi:signal transduction histidine kinase
VGFTLPEDQAQFTSRGHFGLLGLHERAELIGAALEIITKPGNGTKLSVTLPA